MKSNTYANDILKLEFNATPIANLADNAAASPLTNIQVALHSAFPGLAGNQTTNEIAYTGYGRVAVARTLGGFTVTGNSAAPVAAITFGACTAGSATATWASFGTAASGAGKIMRMAPLGSRLGPFTAKNTDTLTIPGLTGVAVNDRVIAVAVDGSTLPTGVTEGTSYFVLTVSGDDITISATQGGATLDLTTAGDGLIYKSTPLVITSAPSTTPSVGTGSVIVEA